MIDKLQAIKDRWLNIQDELNDPMVISNQRKFAQLNRDYKELQKVVEAYEKYRLLVSYQVKYLLQELLIVLCRWDFVLPFDKSNQYGHSLDNRAQ